MTKCTLIKVVHRYLFQATVPTKLNCKIVTHHAKRDLMRIAESIECVSLFAVGRFSVYYMIILPNSTVTLMNHICLCLLCSRFHYFILEFQKLLVTSSKYLQFELFSNFVLQYRVNPFPRNDTF